MALKDNKLINNTNAHMAIDDLLNCEIISDETRQKLKRMKRTLEEESQELIDEHLSDLSDPAAD